MKKNKRQKRKFLNHIDLLSYLKPNTSLEEIIEQIQNDYPDNSLITNLNEYEFYKYLNKKYSRIFIVQHLGHYIVKDSSVYTDK